MINILEKLKAALYIVSGSLLLISCNIQELENYKFDNLYLPKYEGKVAMLLAHDTIRFGDFLKENIEDSTKYSIDDNQRVLFSYSIQSEFAIGDEFVKVEDVTNSKYIESPLQPPAGQSVFTLPKDTTFKIKQLIAFDFPSTKGEELDSLYYSSGKFKFTLNTSFPGTISYIFSTSAFRTISGGDSIVIDSTVAKKSGDLVVIGRHVIDMNGYKTNLVSHDGINEFSVLIDANIAMSAGDQITGSEYLDVNLKIEQPDFDVIFGYFDKDTFDVDEEKVDLSFFSDLGGTGIEFEAPLIEFTVDNSFGIPIGVSFDGMYATYEDNSQLAFAGETLKTIEAPTVTEYGTIKQSVLTIDKNNSNIRDILAGSPTQLVLPLVGYTNLGDFRSNFLWKDSRMDINAKVSIPLKLKVSGFEYEQTIDLDSMTELEGTKNVSVVISTVNKLPFNGSVDLFLLDSDSIATDSLVNQALFISPSSFDANGKVSAASENSTEIVLDEAFINQLIYSDKMKVVIKLDSYNSVNDEFVEIFADYDMILKVGIKAEVSLDINQ